MAAMNKSTGTSYRVLARVAVVLLGLVSILGTGGGGGGGSSSTTPTPTDIPFQLFPTGYFSNGYTRTWHLSGSDNVGDTFTATWTETTQAQTTYNGQPAIPVQSVLSLTNTQTQATDTVTGVDYYSIDPMSLMYYGWTDSLTNAFTLISLSIIPQSATIGTSAINPVGRYSGSGAAAGETETDTWQLTNANNGLANFVMISSTYSGSTLEETDTTTYVIDQQGNRQSVTVNVLDNTGVTVTLSGN